MAYRHRTFFLGLLIVPLIAILGCKKDNYDPPPPPPPSCSGTLVIKNNTNLEYMEVYVDGSFRVEVAPGGYSQSVGFSDNGSHKVDIYEGYSGELLYTDTVSNICGYTVNWALTDPFEAEMDVANNSWGPLDVFVDNIWYGTQPVGTYAYPMREGTHRILVQNSYGGVLYDNYDYFARGYAYTYNIQDPNCVTLDIDNQTGIDVSVSFDYWSQGTLPYNFVMELYSTQGNHRVEAQNTSYSYYTSAYNYYNCGYYWMTLY